jgi:acyl carrier protein
MPGLETLDEAFRRGLALPRNSDVRTATLASLKRWDSVSHLQLVDSIEKAFSVSLTPGDVIDMTSYPAAVEILKKRGVWSLE